MKPTLKIKIAVDAAMSVSMLLLMAYGLVGEAAHEWIGMGMFALFVAHHILNRKWLLAVGKGKYTPIRMVHDYSVAPEAPVRNFEQQLSGKNSSALS